MVKSLHRSLEAKLAAIKDSEHSESEGDEESEGKQSESISVKRSDKGIKRKGKNKDANAHSSDDGDAANQPSTVIYLGHLPVGFEEREITVFLNQFGNVKQSRVSRSKKTGRSRGYAFVQFADVDVAKIVAETMSGYFLLEKRLVCHILPSDKVHALMFMKPKKVPSKAETQKKAHAEVNKRRSADALKSITAKLVQREEMKRKKLADLGIDYDFPGYSDKPQPADESSENSKKKRKMADSNEEEGSTNTEQGKALKSQKKAKKKTKRIHADESVEEKENDATNEIEEAALTKESSKKKKKSKSKTSKKAKMTKKQ